MRNVVLAKFKDIDYALIARIAEDKPTEVYEFVAAWLPDYKTVTWAQGHYFRNLEDAMRFIRCTRGIGEESE